MQGVFIGHLSFYNKNQIRDKLLLVLIFLSYRKLRFHTIKTLREDAHSAQG